MVGHGEFHPLKLHGSQGKERLIGQMSVFRKCDGRGKENSGGVLLRRRVLAFQNLPADFLLDLVIGHVHPAIHQNHVFFERSKPPVQAAVLFRGHEAFRIKMIRVYVNVERSALIPYLQEGMPFPGKSLLPRKEGGQQFQKAVVLRPHHACVQIIVPRNKAPVPHRAQQRSVIQPVPEAVFPALPRKKSQ